MPISRIDFLKQMGLFAGAAILPSLPVQEVIVYDKLYLLHSFVRGFKYYDGPKLLGKMKQGDQVELVREPDNEYDPDAVALHWNQQKIGFVPAESNDVLSKLLDIGFPEFGAEITFLEPEAATWERVAIAISVLRPRPVTEELAGNIAAYQNLKTPRYDSIRLNNSQVARVYWKKEGIKKVKQEEDWYTKLVDHSSDDGIYSLIHNNLNGTATYGNGNHTYALSRQDVVRLQTNLPEEIIQALNHVEARATGLEEYLLLKGDQVEALIPRLTNLVEVTDKAGNSFIKLMIN